MSSGLRIITGAPGERLNFINCAQMTLGLVVSSKK
jgi:hypothetical protein